MPAKIVVVSGADRGKEIWIEDEVTRIGRGSTCAIALSDPKLPEHTATLEFRDGHYNLYSRLEEDIVLNGKTLASRGFDRWQPGKELELPGPVVLRLETERDPKPLKRPRQTPPQARPEPEEPIEEPRRDAEEMENVKEAAPNAAAKKRSNQLTQVLLILLCAAGGVYMWFAETEPDAGPVQSPGAEFSYLVGTMYKKKADDPRYQELREALQVARTSELRADIPMALTNYRQLRDTLVARLKTSGEALGKEDRELLERSLKFVTVRLRTTTDESALE